MRIILCCAGGFSTTMLMDSMKATVKKSQKLDEKDFSFKAIAVDQLQQELDGTDAVVIGPQVSHKAEEIRKLTEPKGIVQVVVDKDTYGQMDGATVLKQVLIAKKKLEMEN